MYREKLLNKVDALDRRLNHFFSQVESVPEQDLTKKPNPEKWSPLQILQHLLISEQLSLAYCKKKLSFDPKLKKRNFRTWINNKTLQLSLLSPFKFKAPSMVAEDVFSVEEGLETITENWLTTRSELREFIQTVPEKYVEAEVYKHPFGMRLSLGGMLDFYDAHFTRHKRQFMRRIA